MSNSRLNRIEQPPTHSQPVIIALTDLINRYTAGYPDLTANYDPAWRSPCEQVISPCQTKVTWHPYRRSYEDVFPGLEQALKCQIHKDIKAFYGSFWSGELEVLVPGEGCFSLLLPWNEEDIERLIINLCGHALQQRQYKLPMTLFFGCTADDNYEHFLSIDNNSGQVMLETPGAPPIRQLANNLSRFLRQLKPAARSK